MKGIVLAGGLGTRLYPLTKVVNKTILPVYNQPMIFYPIRTLVDSGINEIMVVIGPLHGNQIKEVLKYLPLPKKVKMIYVNQPKPLGMADAIGRCEKLSRRSSIIVVTGDNLYSGDFKKEVSSFTKGAVVFLRKVKHPERFGVPVYDAHNKLVRIEEKPNKPISDWVITAPYLFDSQVFDLIKKLNFSARGELEMADLISLYIELGLLKLIKRKDLWLDIGTFETLLKASQYVHSKNARCSVDT